MERAKKDSPEKSENQCQSIMQLVTDFKFFISEDGTPYFESDQSGFAEVWPIESESAGRIIYDRYYKAFQNLPDTRNVDKALKLLAYQAGKAPREKVFYRAARIDDKIFIDTGDANHNYLEVDKEGWRIVGSAPVKFLKSQSMKPISLPKKGGQIADLKKFLNLESEQAFILLVSYMTGALFHGKQYPIAILQGPQGSAKSTTSEILKELIDPGSPSLRSLPTKEEELFIACRSSHLICYDNLSGISPRVSDSICKISTGCGISGRKLYTNGDEYFIELSRPIVINGIDDLTSRPDLADRALVFNLPKLSESNRMQASKLWQEFHIQKPFILGCILDALSRALRDRDSIELVVKPRMVDFCITACAGLQAFGYSKEEVLWAFMENRREVAADAVASSAVGREIKTFMANRDRWCGSATELLTALESAGLFIEAPPWSRSANFLSRELNRISPALQLEGIELRFTRKKHKREIELVKTQFPSSLLSPSSETTLGGGDDDGDDDKIQVLIG